MRRTHVEGSLLLVAYAALAVVLTWPLGLHLATHVPRVIGFVGADEYYAGWALAWQAHALATDPLRFPHANIYWPAPMALFYGTPGFGLLPAFAPLFLASANLTLALNGALLLNLALTAAALHWVVARWTQSPAAGLAAGGTYLTSNAALTVCAQMPQYAALAATPIVIALVVAGGLTWRRTFVLGGLVALQGLTDVVYVGPPLVLTLALAACALLVRRSTRRDGWRVLGALALGVCLLLPVYGGYLAVRWANPDLRDQTIWGASGNVLSFLFSDGWLPKRGPLAFDSLAFVPALAGFALTAVGLGGADGRRVRAWGAAALWFLVGLAVAWIVPMRVPAFRELVATLVARDVLRLGFGGVVGACLLTGLGFAACVTAVSRVMPSRLRPVVSLLLLLPFLASRLSHARVMPGGFLLAEAVASGAEAAALRSGTGPVLALPLGGGGGRLHAAAMYRGIDHWRPLLNGYSSYHPRDFPARMELAARLPDPAALDALRDEAGLTTIVVYANGLPNVTYAPWLRALEKRELPGVWIRHRDAEALVLAVAPGG